MKENYGWCYRDAEGVLWAWTFGRTLESVRRELLAFFFFGEDDKSIHDLMDRIGGSIVDVKLVEVR